MKFAVMVLLLLSPSLSAEESSLAKKLLETLANREIHLGAKTNAVETFDGKLNTAEAAALLRAMDKDLIWPITKLTIERGYKEETREVIEKLVGGGASDPELAVAALRVGFHDLGAPKTLGDAYVFSLEQAAAKPEAAKLLSVDFASYFGFFPNSYKTAVLRILARNNLSAVHAVALKRLSGHYVLPLIGESDLPVLIALTDSKDEAVVKMARDKLNELTHPRKNVDSWLDWWAAEKTHFSIVAVAIEVSGDNERTMEERKFAIRQLAWDARAAADSKKSFNHLKAIVTNEKQPEELRLEALEVFENQMYLVKDGTSTAIPRDALVSVFGSLIDDPNESVRDEAITIIGETGVIEDPKIYQRILAILRNPKEPVDMRATAAEALGETKSQKHEVEGAIREFLKSELPNALRLQWPMKTAARALKRITGVDYGGDPGTIAESLENEGKEAKTAAKPPSPAVHPSMLPLAADENFRVRLESASSLRSAKFKDGLIQGINNELRATLRIVWPKSVEVLATSGYIIEECVTDFGEVVKVDWQTTARGNMSIREWPWPPKYPPNAKEADLQSDITVGRPADPMGGIARLKGYVIMKYGDNVIKETVSPVGDWIGKPLQDPLFKAMKLRISSLDGASLVIEHTANMTLNMKIQGVEVFDENGNTIAWKPTARDTKDGLERHTLTLEKPLPKEGKIVFSIFDTVKEERVPFEFKNLILDSTPVKPPPPPQF